jgi:HD-like signal output (HDOD) protein
MNGYTMGESAVDTQYYLSKIKRHIAEMPPLSTTVTKVMEICNHPNTSPHDLNRVISLDPVLTGKVLRVVNSTYYSPANKVNSLTRAIIMLGLNTVVNLATSTSIIETLGVKESFQAFSMDDFWTHSICVGVMAKLLAGEIGIPTMLQEEYFVAGLLHDLGKLPLNRCFTDKYHQAIDLAKSNGTSLNQAEKLIFNIDHCLVGKMISENWNLSQVLHDTLCCHHDPEEAEEDNQNLTVVVTIANILANMLKIGSSGNCHPDKKRAALLLRQLGVRQSDLNHIHKTVKEEIEKAKIFLQISTNRSSHEN